MGILETIRELFTGSSQEYGPFNLPPRKRVDVDRRASLLHKHYDVDQTEARDIATVLADHLNTSQYNPRDIVDEAGSKTRLDAEELDVLVQQQIRSVQTEDSIRRYQDAGIDISVEWMPPGDGDLSPVCKDTVEEIEARGGAVSIKELNAILRECAEKHPEGTPELMDFWVPHEGNCRCAIAPIPG